MSDRVISLLRTLVPKLWGLVVGAILAWLATHAPWVIAALDWLGIDLDGVAAVVLVVAASEAAWYALWRWLEPRIPDWLTRLVLGSAKAPSYAPVSADGVASVVTSLSESEWPTVPYLPAGLDLPLPGYWSNGDPVHLIVGGEKTLVAPNLNGAEWVLGDDGPKHAA